VSSDVKVEFRLFSDNCIVCSFDLENPMSLVKMLTLDFEIDTSSVNKAHNYSTTPISGNYVQTSRKLITTHNDDSWKCGILKQILLFSIEFNDVKTTSIECNFAVL
jgi:hypothetical protein